MTTTMTFRLEKKQRDKLRSKAKTMGKSESEFLRDILDRELKPRRLGDVIGHLQGALGKPTGPEGDWAKHMRKTNWRK